MAAPRAPTPGATPTADHPRTVLPPDGPSPLSTGDSARRLVLRGDAGPEVRDHVLAAEIDRLDGLSSIQRAYLRERWLAQLDYLGRRARRAQRRYYALRLVAILGGVAIPALVGLTVGGDAREAIRWLTFGLGLLVAAAVALEEFFRFGERWRHFRHQSELLRGEGWAFLERAGSTYRRYQSHAEAFPPFVANVEELIRREVGVYIAEIVRVLDDQRVRERSGPANPPITGPAQAERDDSSAPKR